jgi:hypothetical protein
MAVQLRIEATHDRIFKIPDMTAIVIMAFIVKKAPNHSQAETCVACHHS